MPKIFVFIIHWLHKKWYIFHISIIFKKYSSLFNISERDASMSNHHVCWNGPFLKEESQIFLTFIYGLNILMTGSHLLQVFSFWLGDN